MAEAVGLYTGIVASVATLLQLSKAVAEYIRNTVGANEQRRELLRDITAVDALLKELERKAKLPEWKNTLEMIQSRGSPLALLQ
jgi:predicted transcriptional regulator